MGERRYSSTVLDLGTKWTRWSELSASRPGRFTPRDRRLIESQSRSKRYGEGKNIALPGIEPRPSSPYYYYYYYYYYY
jgi:hypothetical protein